MPRMENNGGDRLARGAASHTFRPMGEKLTRDNWDKMFAGETEPILKTTYIFKCPVHGVFESDREVYLSGGYPLVDENVKGKCRTMDGNYICNEVSDYAGTMPVEPPKKRKKK